MQLSYARCQLEETLRLLNSPVIYGHTLEKHVCMYVTVTSSHPHQAPAQANAPSFTLTPILSKRGDTEMERSIAHAHFTGHSFDLFTAYGVLRRWIWLTLQTFLNGMEAPPNSFQHMENLSIHRNYQFYSH